MNLIDLVYKKIKNNENATLSEVIKLYGEYERIDIKNLANKIHKDKKGNNINLCSIQNIKSGKCFEDCKYCAQSIHYNTEINRYDLLSGDTILEKAKWYESNGVNRFSLVSSGNSLNDEEFYKVVEVIIMLNKKTNLDLCASLGSINCGQAEILKKAGILYYHHNIETCKKYYKNICTTHSYEDRIDTIKNLFEAGIKVCSGGIIGMGEDMECRINTAFELRELGIKSVPLNILMPVKGTPFENIELLDYEEILLTIALFRIVLPDSDIRYAGGRIKLGDFQKEGFKVGINGMIVGDLLTTKGNEIDSDKKMLRDLGLIIKR